MYTDKHKLLLKDIKITPQRMAVMNAMHALCFHPTAEMITAYIQKNHPHIAVGTIYKTLELFVQKGIIKKVMTENDVMRYDAILAEHHHLYSRETGNIEDYFDEELDALLKEYFAKKKIGDFRIEEFRLQLIGSHSRKGPKEPDKKNNQTKRKQKTRKT